MSTELRVQFKKKPSANYSNFIPKQSLQAKQKRLILKSTKNI